MIVSNTTAASFIASRNAKTSENQLSNGTPVNKASASLDAALTRLSGGFRGGSAADPLLLAGVSYQTYSRRAGFNTSAEQGANAGKIDALQAATATSAASGDTYQMSTSSAMSRDALDGTLKSVRAGRQGSGLSAEAAAAFDAAIEKGGIQTDED